MTNLTQAGNSSNHRASHNLRWNLVGSNFPLFPSHQMNGPATDFTFQLKAKDPVFFLEDIFTAHWMEFLKPEAEMDPETGKRG